ncbi:MAG: CDP-alcohol phosphatidyltransferase family protein [Patescibacteria group bacterium]|nr:CDP-alcohol phosphatidyltransferase family protein [Patescibacteria group bacterium]
MHLAKTTAALHMGSELIGKIYRTQGGLALRIVRVVHQWPIFKWVTADILTAMRMVIAFTNVLLFILGIKWGLKNFLPFLLSLTIIAYGSDLFDGQMARLEVEEGKKKKDTNFGPWFDNMADKAVCIPSMFFIMWLRRVYLAPIAMLIVDITLGIFRWVIARKYKIQLSANHYGKFKTWLQGFSINFVLVDYLIPGIGQVGYYILLFGAIPVGILSFLKHYQNAYPQIKRAQNGL